MAAAIIALMTLTSIFAPSFPARPEKASEFFALAGDKPDPRPAIGARISSGNVFFEVCGDSSDSVVCLYRLKGSKAGWTDFSEYDLTNAKAVFQRDRWVCPFWPQNQPGWDITVTKNGWGSYTTEREALKQGRLRCPRPSAPPPIPPPISRPPTPRCVRYFDSRTMPNTQSFWKRCTGVVEYMSYARIVMGGTVDYFRPRAPSTLCQMLSSHHRHEWSPDAKAWEVPQYYFQHFGGSSGGWPLRNRKYPNDKRQYLPFWSWGLWSAPHLDGCCHTNYQYHGPNWRQKFTMDLCP